MECNGIDSARNTVIDIVVEGWRFSRLFARVLSKLDAGEAGRYTNQLRYFKNKLEQGLNQVELRIVDVEGLPFDSGMAVSALNMDEFEASDELLVDHMIEPIVMSAEGVTREGTVMLRKAAL